MRAEFRAVQVTIGDADDDDLVIDIAPGHGVIITDIRSGPHGEGQVDSRALIHDPAQALRQVQRPDTGIVWNGLQADNTGLGINREKPVILSLYRIFNVWCL